jgi:hypothetical protein
VIAYRATVDVPRELAQFTAKLLAAGRRRRGTPRGSRALTCFWQVVLGLRGFRDRTAPDALARDHGISRATACRYLEEVIEVLAGRAPDLRQALERARAEGFSARHPGRHDHPRRPVPPEDPQRPRRGHRPVVLRQGPCLWRATSRRSWRRRVPAVGLRGRTGIGARHHRRPHPRPARAVPGCRHRAASPGRPGIRRRGHRHPYPGQTARRRAGPRYRHPHPQRAAPLAAPPGERGFALLTGRWRTLQHITASPGKIGDIARAALVLAHFEHGYIK